MAIRLFNMWLTFMVIWLILNASLAQDILIVGAGVSLLLAIIFSKFSDAYAAVRFSPQAIIAYFQYFAVFVQELVKANINVMRIVFGRKIEIKPGIVEIKTSLKSRIGRLTLANSITLTPGTLTVDIRGDSLFIHWIVVTDEDPEAATRAIAENFEKYLKVIYG